MKKQKMKKIKNDIFGGLVLDKYEQEIEGSVADINVFKISKKEQENFAQIAKSHNLFKVSKRINIRINNQDLAKVKSKAKFNNIPYQTLISSIVHKYASGDLKVSL